jgi:putative transposase
MEPHEVFNRISAELAGHTDQANRLMINATHLKAHRTAPSLLKWGCTPAVSGAPKAA